jgi:hypothetical protein
MAARSLSIIEHIASGDSWLKQASYPGHSPAEASRRAALASAHYQAAAAKATIDLKNRDELAMVREKADIINENRAEAVRKAREERFGSRNVTLFEAPADAEPAPGTDA